MRSYRERIFTHNPESGMTLLETAVILAVIAGIAVVFLSGLVTNSKATVLTDHQETAVSLARMQMEWAHQTPYVENATSYAAASLPSLSDYEGYSVQIDALPVTVPEDGLQKIIVTVFYEGANITSLETYKRQGTFSE